MTVCQTTDTPTTPSPTTNHTLRLPPELLLPIFRLIEDDLQRDLLTKKQYKWTNALRDAVRPAALVCTRWHHIIKEDPRSFVAHWQITFDFDQDDLFRLPQNKKAKMLCLLEDWKDRFCSLPLKIKNGGMNLFIHFQSPCQDFPQEFFEQAAVDIGSLLVPHAEKIQVLDLGGSFGTSSGVFFQMLLDKLTGPNLNSVRTLCVEGIKYESKPLSLPNLRKLTLIYSSLGPQSVYPNVEEVDLLYQTDTLGSILEIFSKCPSLQTMYIEGGINMGSSHFIDGFLAPPTLTSLMLMVDFEVFHTLLFPVSFPGLEKLEVSGHPIIQEQVLKPVTRPLNTIHFPRLASVKLANCWPTAVIQFLGCNLPALQNVCIDMSGIWGYFHKPEEWKFATQKIQAPNLRTLEAIDLPLPFLIPLLHHLITEHLESLSIGHADHNALRRLSSIKTGVPSILSFPSLITLCLDLPPQPLASLLNVFPYALPKLEYFKLKFAPGGDPERGSIGLPLLKQLEFTPRDSKADRDGDTGSLCKWFNFPQGDNIV
jgi:hypothetical protein